MTTLRTHTNQAVGGAAYRQTRRQQQHTPWGWADGVEEIAEGITFYWTPSHGGYRVSQERLLQMPEKWRTADRWFEEDCEAALVVSAFPEVFWAKTVEHARVVVDRYFRDGLRADRRACYYTPPDAA